MDDKMEHPTDEEIEEMQIERDIEAEEERLIDSKIKETLVDDDIVLGSALLLKNAIPKLSGEYNDVLVGYLFTLLIIEMDELKREIEQLKTKTCN